MKKTDWRWQEFEDELKKVGLVPLDTLMRAEAKITALVSGAMCGGLCPQDWYADRGYIETPATFCNRKPGKQCDKLKIESCWRKFADTFGVK